MTETKVKLVDEHEIVRLQMREAALEKRVDELEAQVKSLLATMRVGKGALLGVVFVLGTAGMALGRGIKALWGIE